MEEEVAMLRQLIGQLQQLLQLHAPPPLPPLPLNQRYCFPSAEEDDDNGSVDDDYYASAMAARQSHACIILHSRYPPPSKKSRKERTNTSNVTTSTLTNMDQDIWKHFPKDLFEPIIARLPISTFFRFRSVCKDWNSLLHSQSFSHHCAQLPDPNTWFFTITHESMNNSGAMYDPSSKKWYHPAISSMLTKTIVLPMASAGGLVCFLDIDQRNFYVCNPLNKSFRELPARSVNVWSRVAVGMTLTTRGYKILWVGCDGGYEVYDSRNDSWAHPGIMPPTVKLPLSLNFKSQAVSSGGTLYFMRSDPDGIVSYDMETGTWKQYLIPAPLHLSDHTLAECGGRILLVGLLTKNAATCVYIWELQRMTLLWKEVDRMPNIWCLDFYGKHVRMTCLGNKGLLMLSLRSRQMNRLITYNVMSREWLKVPHGRKRQWIACGTAFHPSLTAMA
ncbi:hypothetical protein ACFE04_024682 [Oxalis oulophora]